MSISELIQSRHTQRRAAVYVRQSTPHQVISNQESLRIQRSLRERAQQLGWNDRDIDLIDTDLGMTATIAENRKGFQKLTAEIALGEIGILVAYDATRLARNCTHWYQLLDLCGLMDCLIADRDGVYDPSSINGRLLLGLKGQISELELHTLRARLTAGILSKAQRGELALPLPAGLIRLESGQVAKHPDQMVQSRIAMVFDILLQQKTVWKTVRYFAHHGLTIPRGNRFGEIEWKQPTTANVTVIVKNPAYAGTFVFGRKNYKRCKITGKKQAKDRSRDQWTVCIKDKYPAYISWDTFEKIQLMIRDNYRSRLGRTPGTPRKGSALLHGIVYCGECGHQMSVHYKRNVNYVCSALAANRGEPMCQYLSAVPLDEHVTTQFFEALSVAQINLSVEMLVAGDRQRDRLLATHRQEVTRREYEEQLARRQYDRIDPDNRLVAAELERRWEVALRDLREARERLADEERKTTSWIIPADLLEALKDIGPNLPELWRQNLSSAHQKALLRCLVDKVVLHRVEDTKAQVRIVWRGGAATTANVSVPSKNYRTLAKTPRAKEMTDIILQMAQDRRPDKEIAQHLTSLGYRSPMNDSVTPGLVQRIRVQHGLLYRPDLSNPRRIPGYLTIPQLAKQLKVKPQWIHTQIANGIIHAERHAETGRYVFPDNTDALEQIRQFAEASNVSSGLSRGIEEIAP